jgi:hypothetical protein
MRIFVLGKSSAGKTPFARRVAKAFGMQHAGASAWVRERFPEAKPRDDAPSDEKARFVESMTAFAIAELRRDPNVSVASLRARVSADSNCVIEGMRNPYDFTCSFDPRTDHAVVLDHTGGPAPTEFERGLDVIRAYLAWLEGAALLEPGRVHVYRFAEYGAIGEDRPDTLEHAIVDFIAKAPHPRVDHEAGHDARVHAQIPPIVTHVRAEYLYNMDPARVGQLRRATAFTVSSYVGSAPTFQILLGDGAVFSYVPPSALVDPEKKADPQLDLDELVYHDCKSVDVSIHVFGVLRGPVLAYFKKRDLWLAGTYNFTIDWYTGNEMLHCISLVNGQYALLPSHKLKFGDHRPGFEPYKKIRREWVTGP